MVSDLGADDRPEGDGTAGMERDERESFVLE